MCHSVSHNQVDWEAEQLDRVTVSRFGSRSLLTNPHPLTCHPMMGTLDAAPMFKKRSSVAQQHRRPAKRPVPMDHDANSDDDGTESSSSGDDRGSVVVRKQRRVMSSNASNPMVQKSTSRRGTGKEAMLATAKDAADAANTTLEGNIEVARANATRAYNVDDPIPTPTAAISESPAAEGAVDGLYYGQTGYRKLVVLREQISSKLNPRGPIRAPSNLRVTCRFDYKPDICKDYKETGYCGFGDTCIFLHDRSDYKSGWQIDREWDEAQRAGLVKRKPGSNALLLDGSDEEASKAPEDEDLPFACLICRGEFKSPVVTKCGHYFCEKCALQQYSKSSKCVACRGPTSGIFNKATKLIKALEARKTRLQGGEAGEDVVTDDEDDAVRIIRG